MQQVVKHPLGAYGGTYVIQVPLAGTVVRFGVCPRERNFALYVLGKTDWKRMRHLRATVVPEGVAVDDVYKHVGSCESYGIIYHCFVAEIAT